LTLLTPFEFYGGLDVQGFPPAPVGDVNLYVAQQLAQVKLASVTVKPSTPGLMSEAGRARTGRAPSASKEREAGASTV